MVGKSYRMLQLAVPSIFSTKKTHDRGNQHNRADGTQLTKQQAEKRIWGKLAVARQKAPAQIQATWGEIAARKGVRNGNIMNLKREFLMKWVSDPEWQDAYFSQSLNFVEKTIKKTTGTWITVGRLQQLIGKEEAAQAVAGRADTAIVFSILHE